LVGQRKYTRLLHPSIRRKLKATIQLILQGINNKGDNFLDQLLRTLYAPILAQNFRLQ
jgi:hypothetical protein